MRKTQANGTTNHKELQTERSSEVTLRSSKIKTGGEANYDINVTFSQLSCSRLSLDNESLFIVSKRFVYFL